MEEAIALIDRIIAEHKTILRRVQTLERVANDAEAIAGFEQAKEAFVPGRFDQKQGLQKLQVLMETTEQGIQAHFQREETALLAFFEENEDKDLATDFRSLLLEHEDLRNRFVHSKKHLGELTGGGMSRHLWDASANDMRAHISHTRKLLKAHAEIEQELLQTLRRQLAERAKGKN